MIALEDAKGVLREHFPHEVFTFDCDTHHHDMTEWCREQFGPLASLDWNATGKYYDLIATAETRWAVRGWSFYFKSLADAALFKLRFE